MASKAINADHSSDIIRGQQLAVRGLEFAVVSLKCAVRSVQPSCQLHRALKIDVCQLKTALCQLIKC